MVEIAEAVAPVYWPEAQYLANEQGVMPGWAIAEGPWLIPIQPAESRFVALDLARSVLAHIALLDELKFAQHLGNQTCAWLYAMVAAGESLQDYNVFGSPGTNEKIYPLHADGDRASALQRLSVKAHTLRAANRMLEKNIRDTVQYDLAGAEHKRAVATDRLKSNNAAWGGGNKLSDRYNNYGHALRVLEGRVEMGSEGSSRADPACAGIAATELARHVNGPSSEARIKFEQATTPGQAKALCAIEGLGFVVPSALAPPGQGDVNLESARGAFAQQALFNAAEKAGIDPTDADARNQFATQGAGKFVLAEANKISDGDLRFALEQTALEYSLLSEQPPVASALQLNRGGMKVASKIAEEVSALGGTVLAGGIPKDDLAIPMKSRAAKMAAASACPSEYGFQNPFATGQAMAQGLARIIQIAGPYRGDIEDVDRDATANLFEVVQGGIAEAAEWAGASATSSAWAEDGEFAEEMTVTLVVHPDDAGVTPGAQYEVNGTPVDWKSVLAGQYRIVYGPARLADCMSDQRQSCGEYESFLQNYAGPAPSVIEQSDGVRVVFELGTSTLGSITPGLGITYSLDNQIHIIQRSDPRAATATGKVVASLPVRVHQAYRVAISSLKDELVQRVVGISSDWARKGCHADEPTPSFSEAHCVEGAKRNMFVPLENDMTASADGIENSWKHYIEMAKQAAARADALGEQLIEQGLRRDLRREAAQEELAAICGDYAAADKIEFDKYGRVDKPEEDTPLRTCLDERRHPIVFLAGLPPGGEWNDPKWVRCHVLRCGPKHGCTGANDAGSQGVTNPLCSAQGFLAGEHFGDVASLDLAPWEPDSPPDELCHRLADATKRLKSGFPGTDIATRVKEPFLTEANLRRAIDGLRVVAFIDGGWWAEKHGVAVMSAKPHDGLFPGCLIEGAQECDRNLGQSILNFHRTFRPWLPQYPLPEFPQAEGSACGGRPILVGHEQWCVPTVSEQEKYEILWYVQGAARGISGMVGWTPQWLFVQDLPVFSGNRECYNLQWDNKANLALPSLAFYVSPLTKIGDQWFLDRDDEERSLLGPVFDGVPQFSWPASLTHAVPELHEFDGCGDDCGTALPLSQLYFPLYQKGLAKDCTRIRWRHTGSGEVAGAKKFDSVQLKKLLQGLDGIYCPSYTYDSPDQGANPLDWSSLFAQFDIPVNEVPLIPEQCWPMTLSQAEYDRPWRPSCTHPNQRIAGVVNWRAGSKCHAAAKFVQSLSLACSVTEMAGRAGMMMIDQPPRIERVEDLVKLESFLLTLSAKTRVTLSGLYLEQIPERVVDDIKMGLIGSGTKEGRHGELVVQLYPAILQIIEGWRAVETQFLALANAISVARNRILQVNLAGEEEAKRLAIQQSQTSANMVAQTAQMASGVAGMMGSFVSKNPADALQGGIQTINAGAQRSFLAEQQALLNEIKAIKDQQTNAQITGALLDLGTATIERVEAISQSLSQVKSATAQALALAHQIRQTERQANWAAAKLKGEDYVMINGEPVTIPVNTVYNRQYDLTKRRYEKALKEAKYMAYVARLSVEQRLGVRLNTLKSPVGPIDAPAVWADDICHLSGIDYEKMSEADVERIGLMAVERAAQFTHYGDNDSGGSGGTGGSGVDFTNVALQEELMRDVDPYVGDYVAKLENFVEYYNIKYPQHDGDDTVIISLREGADGTCYRTSINLLHYSGQLDQSGQADAMGTLQGWRASPCSPEDAWCTAVLPKEAHADCTAVGDAGDPGDAGDAGDAGGLRDCPKTAVPPASPGAASWIHNVPSPQVGAQDAGVEAGSDAGTDAGAEAGSDAESAPDGESVDSSVGIAQPAPVNNAVYQQVWIQQPGRPYVLTWWDQARSLTVGEFPQSDDETVAYLVQVLHPEGYPLGGGSFKPHVPVLPAAPLEAQWSERREIFFDAAEPGYYTVAFHPSASSSQQGSVMIANVQLEQASTPTGYEHTTGTRLIQDKCAYLSPAELRDKFNQVCDKSGECYYKYKRALTINTSMLSADVQTGYNLARDNYNFRHKTLALNLVGTGILECTTSSNPSCYGNGVVRYTLEHRAVDVPILSSVFTGGLKMFSGVFDFGTAAIRRGQALATERFITIPISSTDGALLGQPGIEKTEFWGRPLDGNYTLRIWDTPDLQWDRLEDVQIVLKYHYWSPVSTK